MDDPFLPADVLDDVRRVAHDNPALTLEFTAHGGHVGFVAGRWPWSVSYYAERRACDFCSRCDDPLENRPQLVTFTQSARGRRRPGKSDTGRMTVLYLASFIGGLLLAVRIMTHGVERPREDHPTGDRSFRLSPLVIVGFTMIFGAVGYLMTRAGVSQSTRHRWRPCSAARRSIIAARLVKGWWRVVPEHDVDDERYVLQGHLARVTKSIGPDGDGEVTFEFGGDRKLLRARGSVGGTIAADTEVVIERVEADVAYVEAWSDVEKRL